MRRFMRRVIYLCRRRRFERDLQEEMRAHREMMSDERRASFGSSLRFQEEARDAWGWNWLDALRHDVAYGLRQLWRAPGFTLTAITVLALGVGLNLAAFHVVKAVASDRIPVDDAASLLRVVRQSADGEAWSFSPEAVRWLQEHADVFVHLVAERFGTLPLQVDGDEADARVQFVSGNYFADLSVAAGQGRLLVPRDDEPGAPPAAVLSDGYWRRRFGADPGVVSSTIHVGGVPMVVAGVLPPGFAGLGMSRGDLWLPMAVQARLFGDGGGNRRDIGVAGRLRPGISQDVAAARLGALSVELRRELPGLLAEGVVVRARPLDDDDRWQSRSSVLPVLVALVLLASCANLGNMLLARGLARQSELSARAAVGASRARLVRQLMTESLLLAALGAIAGLVVGRIGAHLLASTFAAWMSVSIEIDLPVVMAAAVLAVVSAIAFGLLPALQLTGPNLHRASRSRGALVVVQVAVSCMLLMGAGLLVRGAQRQTDVAGSNDFASLVVLEPGLQDAGLAGPALRDALEGTVRRLRELPEVTAVTVSADPLYGVSVESAPGMRTILRSRVDADYFRVMRLPLLGGRLFGRADEDVAIVSASAARAAFGGDDAVGRVWRPGGETTGPVVIGVVENSALAALREPGAVEVYLPMTDAELARAAVMLRTAGDGRTVLRRVRDAAPRGGALPSVWVMQTPVDQLLQHAIAATRMIGVLGIVAAGLAALGLFGLMAFSVRERTREVAIRLALGARSRTIVAMLVGQYTRPLGLGMVAGLLLASAGAHLLAGLRLGLGIETFDTGGYLLGLVLFTMTLFAAVLVPLRRALRIDPAASLRAE